MKYVHSPYQLILYSYAVMINMKGIIMYLKGSPATAAIDGQSSLALLVSDLSWLA